MALRGSSSGQNARHRRRNRAEQFGEFAVEENRTHVLPLGDGGELRLGEPRVHQHQPGAQLPGCQQGQHHAAMVAAQRGEHGAGP
ncbi:hypothetical protein ACW9HR_02880 [Nocardia gipuzkoensis]